MGLPTASSLERAIECPASVCLPQIFSGGVDAERGSAIGAFCRNILAGETYDTAIDRVQRADWRATCQALDFKSICGDLSSVRAEVAYGVQPANMLARELGLNLGRKYPALLPMEFAGTNDLEGVSGGIDVVCDLKSGREVTACSANPQMKFHALARYLVTGAAEVEARLLYVRTDGRVFPDRHRFTAFELDSFADQLVDLMHRLERARASLAQGEVLTVSSGRWCAYCPAYSACPAKISLARAMLPELRRIGSDIPIITSEEAGAAWLVCAEAEKMAKAVREQLKGMARQKPLRTRPGKIVREIYSHSTEFAQGEAIKLLRELGATQEQVDCLFVETPTTQVREVNEVQKRKTHA